MKRFCAGLLLALSCGKGASHDVAVTWHAANGNLGSAITVQQLVSASDGTLYAIVGQSLFKSTDGAVSWQATGLVSSHVLAVAVQPGQPAVLYALTAQDSSGAPSLPLMHSPDSGATWSQAADLGAEFGANGTFSGLLELGAGSPPAIYAGFNGIHNVTALLHSIDGGASFGGTSNVSGLIVSRANPMVAYAISYVGGFSGSVLKSTDNGAHFTQVFTDQDGITGLDIGAGPDDVYVADKAGKISHAVTTASSVTASDTHLPAPSSMVTGALDPAVVLFITADGQLFVSTDGAVTFSLQNGGLPAIPYTLVADQARKGIFYALVPGSGLFASSSIAP